MDIEYTLLLFNIDAKHEEVKKSLERYGYQDSWYFGLESKERFSLTEDTMLHFNKNCNAAIKDLQIICKNLNVILLNSIAIKTQDIVGTTQIPTISFTSAGTYE